MNKQQLLVGVCFWGEEFRAYFVDLCAPSLIADGNLNRSNKPINDRLLIYTTREDWQSIAEHQTVKRLMAMATVEWVEIDFPLNGETKYQRMSKCHLQITERGHLDKKLTVILSSDAILSKGAFELFLKKHEEGYLAVLAPAIRFSKEGIYSQLIKRNLIKCGTALSLSASELTKMSLGNLHHETKTYKYSNNYFSHFPLACYWEASSGSAANALLMHTFSWAVLMMNFTSLPIHKKQCLETWTMDGNYVYVNIGDDPNKIYVVRNSNELIYVSLTRDSERLEPRLKNYRKLAGIRTVFHHDIMDPLKRRLFKEPVFFGDYVAGKKIKDEIKGQIKMIKNGTKKPTLIDQIYLKYFQGGAKIFLIRSLTWAHRRLFRNA